MTWAVGDLALCVNTDDIPHHASRGLGIAGRRLRKGAIYRVAGIGTHPRTGCAVLALEGETKTAAASRFRKIKPDEHEACEPEFVTLIRRVPVTSPETGAPWKSAPAVSTPLQQGEVL